MSLVLIGTHSHTISATLLNRKVVQEENPSWTGRDSSAHGGNLNPCDPIIGASRNNTTYGAAGQVAFNIDPGHTADIAGKALLLSISIISTTISENTDTNKAFDLTVTSRVAGFHMRDASGSPAPPHGVFPRTQRFTTQIGQESNNVSLTFQTLLYSDTTTGALVEKMDTSVVPSLAIGSLTIGFDADGTEDLTGITGPMTGGYSASRAGNVYCPDSYTIPSTQPYYWDDVGGGVPKWQYSFTNLNTNLVEVSGIQWVVVDSSGPEVDSGTYVPTSFGTGTNEYTPGLDDIRDDVSTSCTATFDPFFSTWHRSCAPVQSALRATTYMNRTTSDLLISKNGDMTHKENIIAVSTFGGAITCLTECGSPGAGTLDPPHIACVNVSDLKIEFYSNQGIDETAPLGAASPSTGDPHNEEKSTTTHIRVADTLEAFYALDTGSLTFATLDAVTKAVKSTRVVRPIGNNIWDPFLVLAPQTTNSSYVKKWLVWEENGAVCYASSNSPLDGWDTIITPTVLISNAHKPTCAITPEGILLVFYQEDGTKALKLKKYNIATGTPSLLKTVTVASTTATRAIPAVSFVTGQIWLFFEGSTAATKVSKSNNSGDTWSSSFALAPTRLIGIDKINPVREAGAVSSNFTNVNYYLFDGTVSTQVGSSVASNVKGAISLIQEKVAGRLSLLFVDNSNVLNAKFSSDGGKTWT